MSNFISQRDMQGPVTLPLRDLRTSFLQKHTQCIQSKVKEEKTHGAGMDVQGMNAEMVTVVHAIESLK